MNIVSWNVNSLNVRLAHVQDLLREQAPDIVALQETKTPDERFPLDALRDAGYEVAFSGQKTYNGVAILSRQPLRDVHTALPGMEDDPQRRLLAATIGELRVIDVYIPNGQAVGSDKYAYKMRWLAALERYVASQLSRHAALVLLGDFNIAPADIDVHDPARWREKIMCSSEERAWFQRLLALGLEDAPRRLHPEQPMFSWWDYRLNAYRRGWGLRIDHILISRELTATDAGVAVAMRERERPSDHAPVWLKLAP